jgi:hypothetical protein
MTIFDLTFLGVVLVTLVTLLATAVAAVRRRRRRAQGLLRGLGVLLAVYLGVVIVVSLVSPRRAIGLHEPRCSDDWCITVDHVDRTPAGSEVAYTVTFLISSRARGRAQRENGVRAYVLDDRGRRYEAQEDPQAVPFNVLLHPGDSVMATRRFLVAADAHDPGVILARGRFPGMFIIGDEQSLFHKPSVVRFP